MSPGQRAPRVHPRSLPFALALTLACALAGGAATAQTAQKPSEAQPQQQQPPPQGEQADPGANRTFALEFPGGTLIDYVRAVQKAVGGVNIVPAPGGEVIRLGPA